jgi:polyisoprenoid-binding protein YceI
MRFRLCIARRATAPPRLILAADHRARRRHARHPLATADVRRYTIQTEASELGFKATSRLMNADGRFHRFRGDVAVDPRDLATARISLSIEAASIDTGIGLRDTHLRSADFFDAERFPTITFESQRVEAEGRRATVTGRLTVRGVTREIAVPVDVAVSDVALVASGELVMNRRDYGMVYNSFVNPDRQRGARELHHPRPCVLRSPR